MNRADVVQTVVDRYNGASYLEIGVSTGETFNQVRARRKVAVDPAFGFSPPPNNPSVQYHSVASDKYFGNQELFELFDVIFLDGLHTFEQTLRDFTNSIDRLNRGGLIVIDDVLPNHWYASIRDYQTSILVRDALKIQDRSWMGDTYRLVFFLKSFFQQYDYATVADNHGQLVVWRKVRGHQARR